MYMLSFIGFFVCFVYVVISSTEDYLDSQEDAFTIRQIQNKIPIIESGGRLFVPFVIRYRFPDEFASSRLARYLQKYVKQLVEKYYPETNVTNEQMPDNDNISTSITDFKARSTFSKISDNSIAMNTSILQGIPVVMPQSENHTRDNTVVGIPINLEHASPETHPKSFGTTVIFKQKDNEMILNEFDNQIMPPPSILNLVTGSGSSVINLSGSIPQTKTVQNLQYNTLNKTNNVIAFTAPGHNDALKSSISQSGNDVTNRIEIKTNDKPNDDFFTINNNEIELIGMKHNKVGSDTNNDLNKENGKIVNFASILGVNLPKDGNNQKIVERTVWDGKDNFVVWQIPVYFNNQTSGAKFQKSNRRNYPAVQDYENQQKHASTDVSRIPDPPFVINDKNVASFVNKYNTFDTNTKKIHDEDKRQSQKSHILEQKGNITPFNVKIDSRTNVILDKDKGQIQKPHVLEQETRTAYTAKYDHSANPFYNEEKGQMPKPPVIKQEEHIQSFTVKNKLSTNTIIEKDERRILRPHVLDNETNVTLLTAKYNNVDKNEIVSQGEETYVNKWQDFIVNSQKQENIEMYTNIIDQNQQSDSSIKHDRQNRKKKFGYKRRTDKHKVNGVTEDTNSNTEIKYKVTRQPNASSSTAVHKPRYKPDNEPSTSSSKISFVNPEERNFNELPEKPKYAVPRDPVTSYSKIAIVSNVENNINETPDKLKYTVTNEPTAHNSKISKVNAIDGIPGKTKYFETQQSITSDYKNSIGSDVDRNSNIVSEKPVSNNTWKQELHYLKEQTTLLPIVVVKKHSKTAESMTDRRHTLLNGVQVPSTQNRVKPHISVINDNHRSDDTLNYTTVHSIMNDKTYSRNPRNNMRGETFLKKRIIQGSKKTLQELHGTEINNVDHSIQNDNIDPHKDLNSSLNRRRIHPSMPKTQDEALDVDKTITETNSYPGNSAHSTTNEEKQSEKKDNYRNHRDLKNNVQKSIEVANAAAKETVSETLHTKQRKFKNTSVMDFQHVRLPTQEGNENRYLVFDKSQAKRPSSAVEEKMKHFSKEDKSNNTPENIYSDNVPHVKNDLEQIPEKASRSGRPAQNIPKKTLSMLIMNTAISNNAPSSVQSESSRRSHDYKNNNPEEINTEIRSGIAPANIIETVNKIQNALNKSNRKRTILDEQYTLDAELKLVPRSDTLFQLTKKNNVVAQNKGNADSRRQLHTLQFNDQNMHNLNTTVISNIKPITSINDELPTIIPHADSLSEPLKETQKSKDVSSIVNLKQVMGDTRIHLNAGPQQLIKPKKINRVLAPSESQPVSRYNTDFFQQINTQSNRQLQNPNSRIHIKELRRINNARLGVSNVHIGPAYDSGEYDVYSIESEEGLYNTGPTSSNVQQREIEQNERSSSIHLEAKTDDSDNYDYDIYSESDDRSPIKQKLQNMAKPLTNNKQSMLEAKAVEQIFATHKAVINTNHNRAAHALAATGSDSYYSDYSESVEKTPAVNHDDTLHQRRQTIINTLSQLNRNVHNKKILNNNMNTQSNVNKNVSHRPRANRDSLDVYYYDSELTADVDEDKYYDTSELTEIDAVPRHISLTNQQLLSYNHNKLPAKSIDGFFDDFDHHLSEELETTWDESTDWDWGVCENDDI